MAEKEKPMFGAANDPLFEVQSVLQLIADRFASSQSEESSPSPDDYLQAYDASRAQLFEWLLVEALSPQSLNKRRSQIEAAKARHPEFATQINRAEETLSDISPSSRDDPEQPRSRFEIDSAVPPLEGGQGQVYVATDNELGRRVALKAVSVLGEHRRFDTESSITAALSHPGILPIYGKGILSDGRPYYAMRLIEPSGSGASHEVDSASAAISPVEGEDLTSTIRLLHSDPILQNTTAWRELFHATLNRFVSVCNTVGYAHSEGVIHRDLKPGNIMVGSFGETLVIDWGLAKRLTCRESKVATVQPTDSEEKHSLTLDGTQLGTPRYMSPEQQRGEPADKQSDIFSLGAILHEIATGSVSTSSGDSVNTSLCPLAPRPILAIAEKAIQQNPDERFATVDELRIEVENFLGDKRVSVATYSPTERLRRWGRQHPKVSSTIAAALVMFALLTSIYGAQLSRALASEKKAAIAARDSSSVVVQTVTELIDATTRQITGLPQSSDVRQQLISISLKSLDSLSRDYANTTAIDVATVDTLNKLTKLTLQFPLEPTEFESLPTGMTPTEIASRYLRRAEEMALEIVQSGGNDVDQLIVFLEIRDSIASYEYRMGRTAECLERHSEIRDLAAEALGKFGSNRELRFHLTKALQGIGDCRAIQGEWLDAKTAYSESLEHSRKLGVPGYIAAASERLADVHIDFEEYTEAIAVLLESHKLRLSGLDQRDVATFLECAVSHTQLGDAYKLSDQAKLAEKHYRDAAEMAQSVLDLDSNNNDARRLAIVTLNLLGDFLTRDGRSEDALQLLSKSVALAKAEHQRDPRDMELRRLFASTLFDHGKALKSAGRHSRSLDALQESIALWLEYCKQDPGDVSAALGLSEALHVSGETYEILGEEGKANEADAKAQEIIDDLVAQGLIEE